MAEPAAGLGHVVLRRWRYPIVQPGCSPSPRMGMPSARTAVVLMGLDDAVTVEHGLRAGVGLLGQQPHCDAGGKAGGLLVDVGGHEAGVCCHRPHRRSHAVEAALQLGCE